MSCLIFKLLQLDTGLALKGGRWLSEANKVVGDVTEFDRLLAELGVSGCD